MKLSKKTYFICVGLLAAVTAVPLLQLALIPLILLVGETIGGLLLKASVFANTVLLYSVLLLPLWIILPRLQQRTLRAMLAAAAIILVATLVGFGLPAVASYRLARFISDKSNARIDQWAPMTPRSIALISDSPFHEAGCGTTCQKLLYNYQVEKVVAVHLANDGGSPLATGYQVEKRTTCEDVAGWQGGMLPVVQSRIAAGECLVASGSEDMEKVDATIVDLDWRGSGTARDESLAAISIPYGSGWAIERLHSFAIYAGGLGTGRLMLRDYEIKGWYYAMPLHFIAETGDCLPCGVEIETIEQELAGISPLEKVLSARFGFNLDWRTLDQVRDKVALARSILARPPDQNPRFNAAEIAFLESFIDPKIGRKFTPEEAALLPLLLKDTRVNSSEFAGAIYRRKEMEELMPLVLDRITAPVPERDARARLALNDALFSIGSDVIVANQNRIRSIASDAVLMSSIAIFRTGIIARLGDLGPEGVQTLRQFLRNDSAKVVAAAAVGLCRIGSPDAISAEPELIEAFSRAGSSDVRDRPSDFYERDRSILLALIRLNGAAELENGNPRARTLLKTMWWEAPQRTALPRSRCRPTVAMAK